MRTKFLQKPRPIEGQRGKLSPVTWEGLMVKAIERAEHLQDRRLEGLKRAMADGKSELFLRKLGIICLVDLDREFPGATS